MTHGEQRPRGVETRADDSYPRPSTRPIRAGPHRAKGATDDVAKKPAGRQPWQRRVGGPITCWPGVGRKWRSVAVRASLVRRARGQLPAAVAVQRKPQRRHPRLLETSDDGIDEMSRTVGNEDPVSLRRFFKPARFRAGMRALSRTRTCNVLGGDPGALIPEYGRGAPRLAPGSACCRTVATACPSRRDVRVTAACASPAVRGHRSLGGRPGLCAPGAALCA
jgi:hypothetical protein